MVEQKVLQDFVDGLKPDEKEVNDIHTAIVSRIDDEGVVWVNINGSDKETPTELVATEVKRGDAVTVQWRNNKLYIASNYTNPSAGVVRVSAVEAAAQTANTAANNAVDDAGRAREAAEAAIATAESVHGIAEQAAEDAADAKQSATNASEYAARALGNLSTVQSVAETLNWITQHGTMTLTSDTQLDPTHVYFVRDNNGDYEVGNYRYSVVTEPDVADISTYYELSIDESLNNYVGTHLAVTSEGLWILPEGTSASSHKILIATGGQGHTYETAGTYIIDAAGDAVAKFTTSGAVIGIDKNGNSYFVIGADGMQTYRKNNNTSEQIVNLGYGLGTKPDGTQGLAPYVTLGRRKENVVVGNYSVAEGIDIEASGYSSHAEGYNTTASGYLSHAEGEYTEASEQHSHAEGGYTKASGIGAHAEGEGSIASGDFSHAQNGATIAAKESQTAIGKYNIEDTESLTSKQKALIIGNGTGENSRSNALTVDWQGNVWAAGTITENNGTRDIDLNISEATITKYVNLGMSLT